jgi:CRISPR/Cas system CSM-associated protein Csm3 (group 7 of RAMP superfamily)
MIPKHDNPTRKRRGRNNNEFWAYAPYNFVPLPEKVVLVDNVLDQDVYTGETGYIECSMTTESPLYTRCGMKDLYLFNWGDVPGSDSEKVRNFLKDICKVRWLENAEISKSTDGKTIRITKEEHSAEIVISEKEEKATLIINDDTSYELKLKIEMGELKIYLNLFSEFGEMSFDKLPEKIQNERAQFFHIENKRCPLIPGSSLRGMVRALVEIAGYGKVQWVTDKNLVYRAVGEGGSFGRYYRSKLLGPGGRRFDYPQQTVRGGYLRKKDGTWWIQPAKKDFNKETFVHVEYDVVCEGHDPEDDYTADDLIDIFIRPPKGRINRTNRVTLRLAVVEKASDVDQTEYKPAGFEKAVLVRSGHMRGKHMHCAIYESDDKADSIQIPDKMWHLYEEDRDMARGFKTRPLKNDGDPLFYLVDVVDGKEQLVFFGPTMMFRLPYDESINNFVPDRILKPCGIDLAEAIFGYIDKELFLFSWDSVSENNGDRLLQVLKDDFNVDWAENAPINKSDDRKTIFIHKDENSAEIVVDEKKEKATLKLSSGRSHDLKIKTENGMLNLYYMEEARAGRVFFTDAKVEPITDGTWLNKETITPKVLSSPKPTSFQHYLVQDLEKNHNPDDKNSLAHYGTPSPDETVIRGCKMYWHKGDIPLKDIEANPADVNKSKTQYTHIRPVNTGVTFTFRIYFENLHKYELGALLWALTLPGEADEYRHKLGMGKPLGMGAVKIEPKLYISNRIKRYKRLFDTNGWVEAADPVDPEWFVKLFEDSMLDSLRRGGTKLNEVERIKMLLKMLEWPGPPPSSTRYLEGMQSNEYKERPVLPDPYNIRSPRS